MHGIPLRTMKFMGDSGIGYHRQFIGPRPSFATKPRECPGDRKVAQIPGIIALAVKKAAAVAPKPPVEDDMTDAQYNSLNKKLDEVKGYAESAYNSLNGAVQTFERRDVERDAALDAAVQRVEDVAKATLNRVDTAVNTLVEAIQGMNRPTPTSDVRDGLEGLGEGLPSDPK
jgi:hypothetical protein